MLWKTADGKTVQMSTLDSPHLMSIIRMLRNKMILAARENLASQELQSLDDPALDRWEIERALDSWGEVIAEALILLRGRGETVPSDLLPKNFPGYIRDGTPDLKIPPHRQGGFDPQNPKFKRKIQQMREERKPPKKRTRDLLDY